MPQPRAAHLEGPTTNRDLFKNVRGKCTGCNACGRYIINIKERYTSVHQSKQAPGQQRHPDNDLSITFCSRCNCPPEKHEIIYWESEREHGSDAFALHQWDTAILHYTRAIESHSFDAALWTNRAAAYLEKGWFSQALHDAEHAASLRSDWFRPWARKGAALMGLGRPSTAVEAYRVALQRAEEEDPTLAAIQGIKASLCRAEIKAAQKLNKSTAAPVGSSRKWINVVDLAMNRKSAAVITVVGSEKVVLPRADVSEAPLSKRDVTGAAAIAVPVVRIHTRDGTRELFSEIERQCTTVEKEVHRLKALMEQLRSRLDDSTAQGSLEEGESVASANDAVNANASQREVESDAFHDAHAVVEEKLGVASPLSNHTENVSSEFSEEDCAIPLATTTTTIPSAAKELVFDKNEQVSSSGNSSLPNINSSTRSINRVITEDGNVDSCSSEESEQEIKDTNLASSPTTSTTAAAAVESEIFSPTSSADTYFADDDRKSVQDLSSATSSSSSSSTTSSNEFDRELDEIDEWISNSAKAAQKEAQKEVDSQTRNAFIHPPSSSSSSSRGRQKEATTAAAAAAAAAATTTPRSSSKLDLRSLQSLLFTATIKSQRTDPHGVERVACKSCGAEHCPQYENSIGKIEPLFYSLTSSSTEMIAQHAQQARKCAACHCDCDQHETLGEAAERERRQERLKRQQQERWQQEIEAASKARHESESRIEAAIARRLAAEAAGESLQCTECDVLTQAKRAACTSCKICPGFVIYYATTDANDPEVMFYCSECGCRAECHPVDAAWEKKEVARRAAAAAAAARAAEARRAYTSAPHAARTKESDAYTTLGLHYGADSKAVSRAYKKLALKLHPDRQQQFSNGGGGGDSVTAAKAHAAFVRVNQAYKLLTQ